jgi:Ca2+:H+ antiporter
MPSALSAVRREWPLLVHLSTTGWFVSFGRSWLADLSRPVWFAFILTWLVTVSLLAAFAVVRHAEALAVRVGEPLGTLVLTLAVTGVEVMMIAAVMLTGHGTPALARDTMFAVVMIVLNGMVGLSLLLGGLWYHEQTYNLLGATAFLAVIVPLAVLGLILPNFTVSAPGPTLSPFHATLLSLMSLGLYSVFLAIQNVRHRDYFLAPSAPDGPPAAEGAAAHGGGAVRSVGYHALFLAAYLLPLALLAKQLAVPIDYGIRVLQAPVALGGFLVAALILAPESLTALRAALANQLQRAVNVLLGSVLATISLTIPAVLAIGVLTGTPILLGLGAVDALLLVLTLGVSMLTFASPRTNVLLGAVHLLLFCAYVMLIFER